MRELSDNEVFGATGKTELSDDDVFGPSQASTKPGFFANLLSTAKAAVNQAGPSFVKGAVEGGSPGVLALVDGALATLTSEAQRQRQNAGNQSVLDHAAPQPELFNFRQAAQAAVQAEQSAALRNSPSATAPTGELIQPTGGVLEAATNLPANAGRALLQSVMKAATVAPSIAPIFYPDGTLAKIRKADDAVGKASERANLGVSDDPLARTGTRLDALIPSARDISKYAPEGVKQLAQIALLGPNAIVADAAIQGFDRAGRDGLSLPLQLMAGAGSALTEGVPEKLGATFAMKALDGVPLGRILRGDHQVLTTAIHKAGAAIGVELGTEQVSAIGGYFLDKMLADPSATPERLQADMVDAFKATMIQGPTMIAGAVAAKRASQEASRLVDGARELTHTLSQPAPREPGLQDYQDAAARIFGTQARAPAKEPSPTPPAAPPQPPQPAQQSQAVADILSALSQAAIPNQPLPASVSAPLAEPLPSRELSEAEVMGVDKLGDPAVVAGNAAQATELDRQAAPRQPDVVAGNAAQATELDRQAAPRQPDVVADEDGPVGRDFTPLSQGGQPFKTRREAQAARKLQPHLRVKLAPDGNGHILIPASPAQLRAGAQAARRLRSGSTGNTGKPMSAHEFIISKGGMDGSTRVVLGIEGNPRFGSRFLFAGKGKPGLTIEKAMELLHEAGYIPEESGRHAIDTIALSVKTPQYNSEGWERIAQAEMDAAFEDHLAAQQEEPSDPFGALSAADLEETGYAQASPEIQEEVRALRELAEQLGADDEGIMDALVRQHPQVTNQEFYELAKTALITAIEAAQSRGHRDSRQDNGARASDSAGQTAEQQEWLSSYTPDELRARQQARDRAAADQQRLDREAERRSRAEREAKDIATRQDASAENYALGQSAEDTLSGQASIFDEPKPSAPPTVEKQPLKISQEAFTEILTEATQEGEDGDSQVNEEGASYQLEGKNAITGDLERVNPAVREAVRAQLDKRDPAERERIERNLEQHKSTAWAAAAVKGMAYRELLERAMAGQDTSQLERNEIWGKQDMAASQIIRTMKQHPRMGDKLLRSHLNKYDFIGGNRKAENDISASFSNCDPSLACAKFCYAAGSNARPSEIAKSEFTEFMVEHFPQEMANKIASDYKATEAGKAGLSLRLNDKGDLSKAQVKLIGLLNEQDVAVQVFSKRPERLRELSDVNLKMLSVDGTNIQVAYDNPDLRLAVTITDETTEAMLRPIHDRVSVYLPVNMKGSKIGTTELKERFPGLFSSMRSNNLCPVDGGKLDTKPGVSFVDIRDRTIEKGVWTCTACDLYGNAGCFKGDRRTNQRKAAMQLQSVSLDSVRRELAAKKALLEIQKQLDLLQSLGGLNEQQRQVIGATLSLGQHDLRSYADAGAAPAVSQGEGAASGQSAASRGRVPGTDGRGRGDGGRRGDEGAQVEAPRKTYTNDRQLQLFLDNGPDPSQAGPAGQAAQRRAVSAVDDLRSIPGVLAQTLSGDLAAKQRTNLVGQKVSTPEDLAALAQVYRDPRFETFRIVFVNDAGAVVSQLGLTSRLPAAAPAIVGRDLDSYIHTLTTAAHNNGASGFYLLHNHPSGHATASRADELVTINFSSRAFQGGKLKFHGHVVIDTNEFSVIDGGGRSTLHKKDFGQVAPMSASAWSGLKISGPADVMQMTKSLHADPDAVTLIMLDAQHFVRGVTTVPRAAISSDPGVNRRMLMRATLKLNAAKVVAVSHDERALMGLNGLVLDGIHVGVKGSVTSLAQSGVLRGGGDIFPSSRSTRVTANTSPEFAYLRQDVAREKAQQGRTYGRVREPQDASRQIDTPAFKAWYGDWQNLRGGADNGTPRHDDRRRSQDLDAVQRPGGLDADIGAATQVGAVTFTGTTGPVGASGEPVVMYHGTRDDIAAFDLNHPNRKDKGWLGRGVYASSSADLADLYAGQKQGAHGENILPIYMAVRNPFVATVATKRQLKNASQQQIDAFTQSLQAQGHDGVVMAFSDGHIELMAFEPTRVKSATGNNGNFDGMDPSIVREPDPEYKQQTPLKLSKPDDFKLKDVLGFERDAAGRRIWTAGRKGYDAGMAFARDHLGGGFTKMMDTKPPAFKAMMRKFQADNFQAQQRALAVAKSGQELPSELRTLLSDIIEKEVAVGDNTPEGLTEIAATMSASFAAQAQELIELGMMDSQRQVANYLPRVYRNPLIGKLQSREQIMAMMTKVRMRIQGDRLKSRGMTALVPPFRVRDMERLGWRLSSLPDGSPVPADLKTAITQGQSLPARFNEQQKLLMWRDFTKAEREDMGEVRDAFIRYAMGYVEMQKDLATGRLFKAISEDQQLASTVNPGGWVKVPDKIVFGTHDLKMYGALSGMYVEPQVADQLKRTIQDTHAVWQAYDRAMSLWKEGKTVWNPVAHGNNIVSNLFMAHFAGINFADPKVWRTALKAYRTQDALYLEAVEYGLLGTEFANAEIQAALMPELSQFMSEADVVASRITKMGEFLKKAGKPVAWYRERMQKAYEFEDQIFKLMVYIDRRAAGSTPDAAVDDAERYFFNYADMPEGIQWVKRLYSPFFSYTYNALPALLHTVATRPDRLLLPMALLGGANWLGYAMLGDDGDEEDERKNMPDFMKGHTSLGGPKSVRLPINSPDGNPYFLDMSRRVPLGDIFDMNNQMGGIEVFQPLMPSHPVLWSVPLAITANKDNFTGRELTKESDTDWEKATKRAGYLYRQLTPNAAFVPGSYAWDKIGQGLASYYDTQLGPYTGFNSQGDKARPWVAAVDVTGVAKVRESNTERNTTFRLLELRKEVKEVEANIKSLGRQHRNGAITDQGFEQQTNIQREKIKRLQEKMGATR